MKKAHAAKSAKAKARNASEVIAFSQIPNIGPAMIRDFEILGIKKPVDLRGKDAFALYQKISKKTGIRHDPCVLDTYMAAVDFMNGAPARAWWKYTKERKAKHPNI